MDINSHRIDKGELVFIQYPNTKDRGSQWRFFRHRSADSCTGTNDAWRLKYLGNIEKEAIYFTCVVKCAELKIISDFAQSLPEEWYN